MLESVIFVSLLKASKANLKARLHYGQYRAKLVGFKEQIYLYLKT
jgi:hypothetical protein